MKAPPEIIFEGGVDISENFTIITRPEQEQKNTVKPPSIFEPVVVPDDKIIIDEPDFLPIDDYPDVQPVFYTKEEIVDEPETEVDIRPRFMGKDDKAFREWIISKIKFPEDAINNGLAGTVMAKFIVGTDGKLSNIEIVRKAHPVIDKEVVRVIGNSPEWEPGFKNGKYVRTWYTITISFKFTE